MGTTTKVIRLNPNGAAGPVNIDAFEEWWQLYPRKVGHGEAKREWSKLNAFQKKRALDALRSQLPDLIKKTQDKNGNFCPHPDKWLREGRFEDGPEAPPRNRYLERPPGVPEVVWVNAVKDFIFLKLVILEEALAYGVPIEKPQPENPTSPPSLNDEPCADDISPESSEEDMAGESESEKPTLFLQGGVPDTLAGEAIRLVHETPMPDADEFADEAGSEGTDDAGAARASALRAILIDGRDVENTEWRIKRQWPHLKDTAAAIVESAQRTAEKWRPGETRVIGGMLKRITSVELLNERFVMVAVPGQASCIAQISDALFMTRDDFSIRLGDSVIVTGVDNKGVVQAKDAAKIWFGDCRHRSANKIVFTSRKVGPECFNLWTGFGVTPKAGCCDLICQHIREVICAGRETEYVAFLNLLAWQAQNIGNASRVIVNLYSQEQQVGKGVLLEHVLRPIFGLHGIFSADSGKVFGRFNDAIRGKACVILDEACFAGNRDIADKLKSASGSETASIEGKGLPVIECPVAVNWYMATNHEHAAHVEWGDVRYWILKVSPCRKNDRSYWACLIKEINNGGVEAFLSDLLARDVSGFDPQRDVPRDNDEHKANQRASDPAHPALWLLDCLDSGLWLGSEKWESAYSANKALSGSKGALRIDDLIVCGERRMLPAFLESSYMAWAAIQGKHAQPATRNEFWKKLTDLGFAPQKSNGIRYRSIPDEEVLRSEIANILGVDDVYIEEGTARTAVAANFHSSPKQRVNQ